MDFKRPTLSDDICILSKMTSDRVTFFFNLFSINKLHIKKSHFLGHFLGHLLLFPTSFFENRTLFFIRKKHIPNKRTCKVCLFHNFKILYLCILFASRFLYRNFIHISILQRLIFGSMRFRYHTEGSPQPKLNKNFTHQGLLGMRKIVSKF